jgi:hypothetical protein
VGVSFVNLKSLLAALEGTPLDPNQQHKVFGTLCLQCWKRVSGEKGELSSVFQTIESLKTTVIHRVPAGHRRRHLDRVIARIETIVDLKLFPENALQVLSSQRPLLTLLNEDIDALEEVIFDGTNRMGDIETVLKELQDIQREVLNSVDLDDRFKFIVGGTLELCERAASNIGKFGMEHFREEIGCAYGRLSLEIKNPTNSERATKLADAVLRVAGLAELGGNIAGLVT